MAKAEKLKKANDRWRVNIEIAPGNLSRLTAYIEAFNKSPDRSRPEITLTDALNEALDWYFSQSALLKPELSESEAPKKKRQRK